MVYWLERLAFTVTTLMSELALLTGVFHLVSAFTSDITLVPCPTLPLLLLHVLLGTDPGWGLGLLCQLLVCCHQFVRMTSTMIHRVQLNPGELVAVDSLLYLLIIKPCNIPRITAEI